MLVVMYQDRCFVVTKQSEDFGRSALKRAGHTPLSIVPPCTLTKQRTKEQTNKKTVVRGELLSRERC